MVEKKQGGAKSAVCGTMRSEKFTEPEKQGWEGRESLIGALRNVTGRSPGADNQRENTWEASLK